MDNHIIYPPYIHSVLCSFPSHHLEFPSAGSKRKHCLEKNVLVRPQYYVLAQLPEPEPPGFLPFFDQIYIPHRAGYNSQTHPKLNSYPKSIRIHFLHIFCLSDFFLNALLRFSFVENYLLQEEFSLLSPVLKQH